MSILSRYIEKFTAHVNAWFTEDQPGLKPGPSMRADTTTTITTKTVIKRKSKAPKKTAKKTPRKKK